MFFCGCVYRFTFYTSYITIGEEDGILIVLKSLWCVTVLDTYKIFTSAYVSVNIEGAVQWTG